jgi:hypothetical protein
MVATRRAPNLTVIDAVSMLLDCLSSSDVVSTRAMLTQVRFATSGSDLTDEELVEIIALIAADRQMAVLFDHRKGQGKTANDFFTDTIHPRTGRVENAEWLDGYFAPRRYGVRFADGEIYPEENVRLPE